MLLRIETLALAASLMFGFSASAQSATYEIDPAHSTVEFSIKHMAISNVHGRFAVKSGTILLDMRNPDKSSVVAIIDIPSLDSGTPQRDAHVKSPDFFDAARFPTAIFKSTSVKKVESGFDVYGDLTMHGVTKPVTLHMEEPSKDQIGTDGKAHRGFSAETTLHRQDFGLVYNGTLKSGDVVIGDDVKLTFDVEASIAQ